MPHLSLGRTIRAGTKWLIVGSLGGQVLQFAFGVVLARLLLPADFGLLVTVQIFTGFVGMVASGGMGEAIVQAKEAEGSDYQTVFTFQLAVGALVFLGFYFIAPWFALWFEHAIYEDLLRVSALSFLIRPFGNNPSVRLRRAMRFKETAVVSFVGMAFTGVASILMAWWGWGVWSLMLSGLGGALLSAVLLSMRAPWRPAIRYDRAAARRLGAYGAKNVLNELLVYFRDQTPNFIITKTTGPAAVGLYNKASSLRNIPLIMMGHSTYQTVFRAMSKVQDDLDTSRYIYFRTLTLLAFYTFPVYLAMGWVAEPLIVGVFGPNWQPAALPMTVLCLAAPFSSMELTSGALVAARNRLGRETMLQFQAFVLMAIGCWLAAPHGVAAVAAAVFAVTAFMGLRLTNLALSTIGGHWRQVGATLRPVLTLCVAEIAALMLANEAIQYARIRQPLLHTAFVGGAGLFAYALVALVWPPAALVGEVNRWRGFVRLSPLQPRP